jgi:hypothetical protein
VTFRPSLATQILSRRDHAISLEKQVRINYEPDHALDLAVPKMFSTADDLLPRTTAGENVEWPLGYASVQPDRLIAAGVGEINPNADFCIEVSPDTEADHNPCDRDPCLRA